MSAGAAVMLIQKLSPTIKAADLLLGRDNIPVLSPISGSGKNLVADNANLKH
jgi:hypothetical protein